MIKVKVKNGGKYSKIGKYLSKIQKPVDKNLLEKYGAIGVDQLRIATPVDTGETANSWYYTISEANGVYKIKFCNSNNARYIPVVILIQYGHMTGNGAWIEGIDFINPAIKPVFERIKNDVWKEVTSR